MKQRLFLPLLSFCHSIPGSTMVTVVFLGVLFQKRAGTFLLLDET
jgi:hypothetical protein